MKRISNVKELIAERRKKEALIAGYKLAFREDFRQVKEKIDPFFNILPFLNIFKKKSGPQKSGNHSIVKAGASLAIDVLVGQNLLRKASWFTRLIVPNLLKMFSSAVIGGQKSPQAAPHVLPVIPKRPLPN